MFLTLFVMHIDFCWPEMQSVVWWYIDIVCIYWPDLEIENELRNIFL